MAITTNGAPAQHIKEETPSIPNTPNGQLKGPIPRRKKPTSASTGSHVTSIFARLMVWYVILVAAFQCPSSLSELNDASPTICKPYLNARSYIQPYIQPYYDTYASSYVEKVRPHADRIHQQAIRPASSFAKKNYVKYAAPRLDEAVKYGQEQWQKSVVPQIVIAQQKAHELYSASVAPHVRMASSAAEPYYGVARDNAMSVHEKHILPAIDSSRPVLWHAYNSTRDFTISTGLPYTQRIWYAIVIFVDGTLWPKVKGLYGDNVKPQLVMISERIAKYQEGRKMKAAMDEVDSSISASSPTSTTSSSATGLSALSASLESLVGQTPTVSDVSVSATPTTLSSDEQLAAAKKQITSDLHIWQEKFAVAADKGSEDLAERVKDIVEGLMTSGIAGQGTGLATALNKTTEVEMANVKAAIKRAVSHLPDEAESSDAEKANKDILDAIRTSGLAIRNRANAVRQWYSKFEAEVNQRVIAASDSTLDVLDGIRDLGLQEIGMRWAWMEGVTYKDWAKYHDLKKQFDAWRNEVRDVALKHSVLDEAKKASENIVEDSMDIAADAARELARLKDVGKWKVAARDSGDDFDTRVMPAAVVSAASKLSENIKVASESVVGTSQGTIESVASQVTGAAFDAASVASSVVIGTEQATGQSILSKATEAVAIAASSASSAVVGTEQDSAESIVSKATEAVADAISSASSAVMGTQQGTAEAMGSKATEAAVDAFGSASSAIVGTEQGTGESLLSKATEAAADAAKEASFNILGETSLGLGQKAASSLSSIASVASGSASSATEAMENSAASAAGSVTSVLSGAPEMIPDYTSTFTVVQVSPSASSLADAASSSVSSVASKASRKVFAGAMAQEVRSSGPILDDIIDSSDASTYSEKLQSVVEAAGDRYADVTKAVSEALLGPSQGTVESATSLAAEQYSSALAAASSVLYGNTPGVAESFASAASDKYSEAVAAASTAIYGTPTPVVNSAMAYASSVYADAVSRAQDNYAHAKSIASVQVSGTPKPIHEQMFASIESAYSGSLGNAKGRLDSAMSAVSSQYSSIAASPTQGTLESISAIASSRLQEALSLASAQYSSVKTAVGATPTPVQQQYLQDAQRRYYEAIGIAHERYSDFLTVASGAVYGSPTPMLSSLSSAASGAVYGTSAPALSGISSAASSVASSVSSVGSEAVYGTPVPAYQSLVDAASSQYATASSAAASNFDKLMGSAYSAVGADSQNPAQNVLENVSSQYSAALSVASASLSVASASASSVVYGTSTGAIESAASAASQNWEALVAKASEQIYGAPTPVYGSMTAQAGEYASQITDTAAAQYVALQAYVAELVGGKEPDFTESVMNRLSSAYYYTGYHVTLVSSASSVASEAYDSASSVASSVSSVVSSAVSSYYTPPPQLESILGSVTDQLNAAVDAASIQVYGTTTGTWESATSAVVGSYSSATSVASEAVYGTQTGYAEAAHASISDALVSAQDALSAAIYGTPTGTVESATSAAASAVGDTYTSVSSVVAENVAAAGSAASSVYSNAAAKVSEAVYGPEQGALESAQTRLLAAVESAQARLKEFAANAGEGASEAVDAARSSVEEFASSVGNAASSATDRVKDEL